MPGRENLVAGSVSTSGRRRRKSNRRVNNKTNLCIYDSVSWLFIRTVCVSVSVSIAVSISVSICLPSSARASCVCPSDKLCSMLTFISSNYAEVLECHLHDSSDKSNAVCSWNTVRKGWVNCLNSCRNCCLTSILFLLFPFYCQCLPSYFSQCCYLGTLHCTLLFPLIIYLLLSFSVPHTVAQLQSAFALQPRQLFKSFGSP